MDLSVVIPTIKPRSEIEALEYLEQCDFQDYEVIVRDDVPVTKARNEGYRRASAEKIIFLDDDSKPRPGYLTEASKTLEREPAVAGKTIHPRDDLFSGQLTAHYSFGDEPAYVDRFWGCNMGARKEVLDAVGGWDEAMGWGHEEKELAERVGNAYRIYYNPDMVVEHVYAESLRDYWRKKYQLEQGTTYYLRKQGLSDGQIVFRILVDLLTPTNYLGRSLSLLLARSGSTVAGTAGRVVGLFEERPPSVDDERRRTGRILQERKHEP